MHWLMMNVQETPVVATHWKKRSILGGGYEENRSLARSNAPIRGRSPAFTRVSTALSTRIENF